MKVGREKEKRPHRITIYVESEVMDAVRAEAGMFGSESRAARALLIRGLRDRSNEAADRRAIAERFGISQRTIGAVARGGRVKKAKPRKRRAR